MQKRISHELLASLFFDSIIEKVPLKQKLLSIDSKKGKSRKYNQKEYAYRKNQIITKEGISNKEKVNSVYKEQINLQKKCELMKNRLEIIKQQEMKLSNKMKLQRKREKSAERIKNEKLQNKKELMYVKTENFNKLQIKKSDIKTKHQEEFQVIKKAIEINIKENKEKYKNRIEEKKRAYSQRLFINLTYMHYNRLRCEKIKQEKSEKKEKEHNEHIQTLTNLEQNKKYNQKLKNQLIYLEKQENEYIKKLNNTRTMFNQNIRLYYTNNNNSNVFSVKESNKEQGNSIMEKDHRDWKNKSNDKLDFYNISHSSLSKHRNKNNSICYTEKRVSNHNKLSCNLNKTTLNINMKQNSKIKKTKPNKPK